MKGSSMVGRFSYLRERSRYPHSLLDLVRTASARTLRLAVGAMVITWVPAALLSALHGVHAFKWFFLDFAAQSRFLIVIPLLILAHAPLAARLETTGRHFLDENLVREEDRSRFETAFGSLKRLDRSIVARVSILLIVYTLVAAAMPLIRTGSLLPWAYVEGGLSPAGSWYVLVSFPIVIFLLFRLIWRQLVWTWFLHTISRMDLRLVPAHPDHAGGLRFLEWCLWGYIPFSFATGTIVAGGVANHVLYASHPLATFQFAPLVVIAFVLLVCVVPLCVFFTTLLRTKYRAIFQYGALAVGVGQQLEKKWLPGGSRVDEASLQVQDFSATTDLYQVVANVYEMDTIPVGLRSIGRLIVVALVPGVPVVLASIPFDRIMQLTVKMFL